MTTANNDADYVVARKRVDFSVGESVRIVRERQELSQRELSELTGIPQATISAIENERVKLGAERAKVLAQALKCHPAVLLFPGWDVEEQSAAQQTWARIAVIVWRSRISRAAIPG